MVVLEKRFSGSLEMGSNSVQARSKLGIFVEKADSLSRPSVTSLKGKSPNGGIRCFLIT